MANVEEKVKEIVLQVLDVKTGEIVPTATLIDDLNATAIDLVDLVTARRNMFDVDFTGEEAEKLGSVQGALDLLKTAPARKEAKM